MSVRDDEVNGLPKEESFDNSILGNFPVPAEVASAGKEHSENAEEKSRCTIRKCICSFLLIS